MHLQCVCVFIITIPTITCNPSTCMHPHSPPTTMNRLIPTTTLSDHHSPLREVAPSAAGLITVRGHLHYGGKTPRVVLLHGNSSHVWRTEILIIWCTCPNVACYTAQYLNTINLLLYIGIADLIIFTVCGSPWFLKMLDNSLPPEPLVLKPPIFEVILTSCWMGITLKPQFCCCSELFLSWLMGLPALLTELLCPILARDTGPLWLLLGWEMEPLCRVTLFPLLICDPRVWVEGLADPRGTSTLIGVPLEGTSVKVSASKNIYIQFSLEAFRASDFLVMINYWDKTL